MKYSSHENFAREEIESHGSDRSFGLVMAGALTALALLNVWHDGRAWPIMGVLALLFVIAALLFPIVLNPLNRAWMKFGLLLHKIINPVVMALLFYGAVLPTGLIMRAMGKDLLRLKLQPNAKTYWIERDPPGPAPKSMKDQF